MAMSRDTAEAVVQALVSTSHSVASERSIAYDGVMELKQRVYAHRDQILALGARHGARNIRLFGSVARDQAHSLSDLDFLVDLEPGRTLFDLGGLQMDLEALLDCSVDVVTERGLRPRLRERVYSEATLL